MMPDFFRAKACEGSPFHPAFSPFFLHPAGLSLFQGINVSRFSVFNFFRRFTVMHGKRLILGYTETHGMGEREMMREMMGEKTAIPKEKVF